MYKFDLR